MRANEFITETTKTIMVDGRQRPITNSKGQSIHPTEKGILKFWKWFGDSKAVDKQGRPMVVYHGTVSDFSEFKPRDEPNRSNAIWLTPSTDYASEAATSWRGTSGNVMPCYVKIQNPQVVEFSFASVFTPDRESEIRGAGHDGVIGTRLGNLSDDPNTWQIAVFNSSQIKSATGNKGSFVGTSPDISEALDIVDEASYDGNIGFIELVKFNQIASPEQKTSLRTLIADKKVKDAWALLQQVTGTVLKPFNSDTIAESHLMELANAPYPITLHQDKVASQRFFFETDKGDEFAVEAITQDGYIMNIGFAKRKFDQWSAIQTNNSGSETFRILSTVVDCIKKALTKYSTVQEIRFTGANDEPSRVSLYRRFAANVHRFMPEWHLESESQHRGSTVFILSKAKNEKQNAAI